MFDYKQHPATKEYREGWEQAFGKEANYVDSAVNGRAESTSPRLSPPGAPSAGEVPALHSSASPDSGDGAGLPANRVAWLIDAACDHAVLIEQPGTRLRRCMFCGDWIR